MQFLTIRWKVLIPSFLIASAFVYWLLAVHPYLWIHEAKVEALTFPVKSDHSGRIAQLGPREGETVQKGEPLFAFDTSSSRARQEELQLQVHSLSEQLHKQQLEMDRTMQYYLKSPQEENFALFEEAQKQSEMISSKLAPLQAEQASLEQQIQKQIFHAPIDGFILKRMAEEGTTLSSGDTAYTLCDPTRFWIEAKIPEQYLSRVSPGTPVQVVLTAFPNKEWKGKIAWVAPAVTASTISIKISIEDPSFPNKPGLSAKLRLKIRA